jgi:hypothetical protein
LAFLISLSARFSRPISIGDIEDGGFDGFEDLEVAGAAAKISGERFADLVTRGIRIVIEQGFCGDEDCRCAVAALRSAEIGESFLQRMERTVRAKTLYRLDFSPVAFDGEEQAGEDWFAVKKNSAGAAFAEFATVFCAGVVEIFAEHFEQSLVRSEGDIRLLAIQG